MLKQQIRACDVSNKNTLETLSNIPREYFVPTDKKELAFAEIALPIGHGEYMLTPDVEAKMLQALDINNQDKVLEIGTGSGYFTALLASQAKHVYSVDINQDFLDSTRKKLNAININNVDLILADAAKGYDENTPFTAIAITGSMPILPETFKNSLDIGGRLVAILGAGHNMQAVLMTRIANNEWHTKNLFETIAPPLTHCLEKEKFTF